VCYVRGMLPALIVGGLTAWYLGLRAGIIAAIVTAAALLVAALVPIPGITIAIYALVIAWSAAVYFLGAKLTQKANQAGRTSPSWLDGMAGQATSWAKKIMKKN
jgi:Flp pilus assembly protein TadB